MNNASHLCCTVQHTLMLCPTFGLQLYLLLKLLWDVLQQKECIIWKSYNAAAESPQGRMVTNVRKAWEIPQIWLCRGLSPDLLRVQWSQLMYLHTFYFFVSSFYHHHWFYTVISLYLCISNRHAFSLESWCLCFVFWYNILFIFLHICNLYFPHEQNKK